MFQESGRMDQNQWSLEHIQLSLSMGKFLQRQLAAEIEALYLDNGGREWRASNEMNHRPTLIIRQRQLTNDINLIYLYFIEPDCL